MGGIRKPTFFALAMRCMTQPLVALILAIRFAHRCGARAQGGCLPPPTRAAICGRVTSSRLRQASCEASVAWPGGHRGGLPPLKRPWVEEPEEGPHKGARSRGRKRGGSGGVSPPTCDLGQNGPPGPGPPRDGPGHPPGQKSAHFVGYLINLPFGTNMGHENLHIFAHFWDSFGRDKTTVWDTPPNPPILAPFWTPHF